MPRTDRENIKQSLRSALMNLDKAGLQVTGAKLLLVAQHPEFEPLFNDITNSIVMTMQVITEFDGSI